MGLTTNSKFAFRAGPGQTTDAECGVVGHSPGLLLPPPTPPLSSEASLVNTFLSPGRPPSRGWVRRGSGEEQLCSARGRLDPGEALAGKRPSDWGLDRCGAVPARRQQLLGAVTHAEPQALPRQAESEPVCRQRPAHAASDQHRASRRQRLSGNLGTVGASGVVCKAPFVWPQVSRHPRRQPRPIRGSAFSGFR